jgi:hypothetical protein
MAAEAIRRIHTSAIAIEITEPVLGCAGAGIAGRDRAGAMLARAVSSLQDEFRSSISRAFADR